MMKKSKIMRKSLTIALGSLTLLLAAPTWAADGKAVYESVCKVCHGTGVMGAPKQGDKAGWADRMGQGIAKLEENAIKGFKGKKGVMPPKGGNSTLSDDEVKAAVAYMVDAIK